MSYCTAQRMSVTRQVQLLQETLAALERRSAEPAEIEQVKKRLGAAQAELAAIGDCGD